MSEANQPSDRPSRQREALRDWETFRTSYDPEFARAYAGQWVVLYQGRVVAHGVDPTEVARVGNVRKYPGAVMFHVPVLEKQEGVWILRSSGPDA